jgi:hypothetical protein
LLRVIVAIVLFGCVFGTTAVRGAEAVSAEANGVYVLSEGRSGRTEWRVIALDSGEPPTRCFTMQQRSRGGAGSWHFGTLQCSSPWLRLETLGPETRASSLVLAAAATPGYAKVSFESRHDVMKTRRITLLEVSPEDDIAEPLYLAKTMFGPGICVRTITLFGGRRPIVVNNGPDGDPQHCGKNALGSR